jgi:hypothetical protein
MMNKKGEEARPGGAIVLALIAAFVLVMVYLFLFGPGKELLTKVGILIPTLNASQPQTDGIEIIGYNIEAHSLEYYDGQTWHVIEDKNFKVGKKIINREKTLDSFINSYYGRGFPKKFELEDSVNDITGRIYKLNEFYVDDFDGSGNFIIQFYYIDDGTVPGYFKLTPANNLLEWKKTNEDTYVSLSEEGNNKKIGEIANLESNPIITTALNPNTLFARNTKEHLSNINSMQFNFKTEDFNLQEENLITSTTRLGINQDIILENDYSFRKIEQENYLLIYQLHQNIKNPIEIYLILSSFSNYGVRELSGTILARSTTEDNYVPYTTVGDPEKEMIAKASNWRDSFTSPVIFHFENQESKYYCVEKIGPGLTVNLADPKSKTATCL